MIDADKLTRTLFIEKRTIGGRVCYAINPFMRVATREGATYFETVPSELFVQGSRDLYLFDNVTFIEPQGVDRTSGAGMHDLVQVMGEASVRRTA